MKVEFQTTILGGLNAAVAATIFQGALEAIEIEIYSVQRRRWRRATWAERRVYASEAECRSIEFRANQVVEERFN